MGGFGAGPPAPEPPPSLRPPSLPACLQGCPAQLQAALPSLTELDLSDNLVADWSFVQELAAALPSLAALNLSSNRLHLPSLAASAPLLPLAALRTLVLNACDVEWQQAVAVAAALPALRELHLCSNRIASLQLPANALTQGPSPVAGSSGSAAGKAGEEASGSSRSLCWAASLLAAAFPSLEVLDLEDNLLGSWDDVAPLSALRHLSSLLLSGNQLTEVQYSTGTLLRGLPSRRAGVLWAWCIWQLSRCCRGAPTASRLMLTRLHLSLRRLRCAGGPHAGEQPAVQLGGRLAAGSLPHAA